MRKYLEYFVLPLNGLIETYIDNIGMIGDYHYPYVIEFAAEVKE